MIVSYVNLQRGAISGRLGGWAHICGVVDALREDAFVKVVSNMASDVSKPRPNTAPVEIPPKWYYFRIAKYILLDKESHAFVFRKTLVGMYVVFLTIILKKALRGRQKFYIEFNGISGDFIVENPIIKNIFLLSNLLPLCLFDGVYCVNDNIRDRIIKSGLVANGKVFVCKNGGGAIVKQLRDDVGKRHRDGVDIFYYGALRSFYHLEFVRKCIVDFNELNGTNKVRLHLVGPGLEELAGENIIIHGVADQERFADILLGAGGMSFGLIPLNDLGGSRDLEPIKTFDYMRMGLPLIHSSCCLYGFDPSGEISRVYELADPEGFQAILHDLVMLENNRYFAAQREVFNKYAEFLWENRLLDLRRRIKDD